MFVGQHATRLSAQTQPAQAQPAQAQPTQTQSAQTQPVPPTTVGIPDGDQISVELQSDVGSRTAASGSRFVVLTTTDYYVGNALVLPKGSPGYGTVTEVKRAAKGHKDGSFAFTVSRLVAPNGNSIATRVDGKTGDAVLSKEVNGNAGGAFMSFGLMGVAAMRGTDYIAKTGTQLHILTAGEQNAPICSPGDKAAAVDASMVGIAAPSASPTP